MGNTSNGRDEKAPGSRSLRVGCFLLCMPLGGALLAKMYGLASMQSVTALAGLPCCLLILAIWIWAVRSGRTGLADALAIGLAGGMLGTIGYDVVRIPFALTGQLIFASISAYGLWLANAGASSRFTEVLGWSYHYGSGITFGVMYALFMRDRHWSWAILWAFILESIAVFSPFGRIFSLSGNYYAIGIAYFGHIGYALPLGWLVYKWDDSRKQLAELPVSYLWVTLVIGCASIVAALVWPESVRRDARVVAEEFRVEGARLNPDWLRINRNGEIRVFNPEAERVSVRVKQTNVLTDVATNQREPLFFAQPGIYQVFVETGHRSQSSFVIVEPVEEFR